MFSELVESITRPSDKRKRWALVVSATAQAVCLLILILIPLIYTQALPKAILNTVLVALQGTSSQPPAQAPLPKPGPRSVRLFAHSVLIGPGHIPPHVNVIEEPPLPPEAPAGPGPINSNSDFDLLKVVPNSAETVPRPAAPPRALERVPVISTIEAAKLISPNSAPLSATCDSGPHTRQCSPARHHRQRRRGQRTPGSIGSSTAGELRARCRSAMAL